MQRIDIKHRTHWMSKRHEAYGRPIRMTNLDQFSENTYLEYNEEDLSHLAEYKNELEIIELWHWGIKGQAKLATNSNIPFLIVVGYQKENCFWLIPINQIAKDLPWAAKWCNKWISERNYVRILWAFRKIKPEKDFLYQFDNNTPKTKLKPNLQ
jgi:hypothetical protein